MAIKLKGSNANIDLTTNIGQMIKGDDGGYYIPAVDADGILTWTPSEEGMEPVISANIKGPQGLPGKDGKDGAPGEKGEPGKDGTMTFEELTEEQKASLKGEPGEPGKDGEDGENPFVISDTPPTDTTKFWVVEEDNVEHIVYSDDIRKIIVVDEYPEVEEPNILYIKKLV